MIPPLAFFPLCRSSHLHCVVFKQCWFSYLHRLPLLASLALPHCIYICMALLMVYFALFLAPFCVPALSLAPFCMHALFLAPFCVHASFLALFHVFALFLHRFMCQLRFSHYFACLTLFSLACRPHYLVLPLFCFIACICIKAVMLTAWSSHGPRFVWFGTQTGLLST